MNCGIYKITCGKRFYIGSSKNYEKRWRNHQSNLKAGKHANQYMQNLYNKTRGHGFKFEVLIACAEEMLIAREQELIDHHWGDKNFMNLNPKADRPPSMKGHRYSAERNAKISKAHKGVKRPHRRGAGNPMARAVIITTKDDEVLEFDTTKAAAEYFGWNKRALSYLLKTGSPSRKHNIKLAIYKEVR